jgi:uncharacterized protein (UPF0548 family)
MSAAALAPGRDVRADELHDVLDCGSATLRTLADRIEASSEDMALIYRETEIDELWRWVDVGLGQAEYLRAAPTQIAHWRALKAEVMRIHDLVGIDLDTDAAVASLRALAQALDAAA